MYASIEEPPLRRLVTGTRCQVQGCYEIAFWMVRSDDEESHLCAKHTRISMRDSARWAGDASQDQLGV